MQKNFPKYVEAVNEQCVHVMLESEELAPIDLVELRGLKIEKDAQIVIMIMNTDDSLIAHSHNARELVDSSEKKLNDIFEATPRSKIEHYMGRQKGLLTLDARRHVYGQLCMASSITWVWIQIQTLA